MLTSEINQRDQGDWKKIRIIIGCERKHSLEEREELYMNLDFYPLTQHKTIVRLLSDGC
jgi:hypothetical protein